MSDTEISEVFRRLSDVETDTAASSVKLEGLQNSVAILTKTTADGFRELRNEIQSVERAEKIDPRNWIAGVSVFIAFMVLLLSGAGREVARIDGNIAERASQVDALRDVVLTKFSESDQRGTQNAYDHGRRDAKIENLERVAEWAAVGVVGLKEKHGGE